MTQVHNAAPQQSVRWKTTNCQNFSVPHFKNPYVFSCFCLDNPQLLGLLKMNLARVESATSAFGEVLLVHKLRIFTVKKLDLL